MKSFAEIMRNARFSKRIKQKELAEKAGVSIMTIANYESGKSVPSFHIAIKILSLLGVDIKELINGEGKLL